MPDFILREQILGQHLILPLHTPRFSKQSVAGVSLLAREAHDLAIGARRAK